MGSQLELQSEFPNHIILFNWSFEMVKETLTGCTRYIPTLSCWHPLAASSDRPPYGTSYLKWPSRWVSAEIKRWSPCHSAQAIETIRLIAHQKRCRSFAQSNVFHGCFCPTLTTLMFGLWALCFLQFFLAPAIRAWDFQVVLLGWNTGAVLRRSIS